MPAPRSVQAAALSASEEPPRDCPLCPRLVGYRAANAAKEPAWFNAPVPSFGDRNARLLIVGLAPGVGGANRTGRPFTGDYAGELLYGTLLKFGFAKGKYEARPDDGLTLVDARITNAVRCVPPENKPTPEEAMTCRVFLRATLEGMANLKVIVALGRIAHDATLRAFERKLANHAFAHGAVHALDRATLIDSFHCSRYNTNTGKLTPAMFEAVFADARRRLA
jgi:uracil-DNA glycosylase family 4